MAENKGRVTMVKDDLFEDAAQIIFETERGDVSTLQRRLDIGYVRAFRIIEQLTAVGILGAPKDGIRGVIMTADEYANMEPLAKS